MTDTVTTTLPIDSAFTGGAFHLPYIQSRDMQQAAAQAVAAGNLTDHPAAIIIIAITVTALIAMLRQIIILAPALAGSMVRWKENMNIEDSVQLRIIRDRLSVLLFLPFCMTVTVSGIYSPDFLSGLPPIYAFCATTAVFAAWAALRALLSRITGSSRMSPKTCMAANHSSRTFFIILAILMLVTCGILGIADMTDPAAKRKILLYETAFIYALFFFRKAQIFSSGCSLFSAILYLCALEILPSGIMIASAIAL